MPLDIRPIADDELQTLVETSGAGFLERRDYRWGFDLGVRASAWGDAWKGFLAIHRDAAGTADGFARYHATEYWDKGQPS